MNLYSSAMDKIGGNGSKAYRCSVCSGLVASSDQLLLVGGNSRHLFTNPSGVECDFHTFFSCPGAIAMGQATEADTWFPGYIWRFAFCSLCGQHLGWHYEASSELRRPVAFWGILASRLIASAEYPRRGT